MTIDTGTDHLRAEIRDGVAILTMNRPEARNALSNEMRMGMTHALAEAETNPEVGAVILTGAGGAFCAGGDVKGMAAGKGGEMEINERIYQQRLSQRSTAGKIFEMPKPVIGAIPGPAAGAGFALALSCDMRVMADNTFLMSAFANVAFPGDYGGSYFLTQLVGAAKAREIYFLSERIQAEEALRLGIVNWLAPQDQVMDKAMEIATRLANGPRIAYRYMKENLNRAMGGDLEECLDMEATHMNHVRLTEDHQEAAKAFVEKRKPTFKGR